LNKSGPTDLPLVVALLFLRLVEVDFRLLLQSSFLLTELFFIFSLNYTLSKSS
jgi:hypothetical protein